MYVYVYISLSVYIYIYIYTHMIFTNRHTSDPCFARASVHSYVFGRARGSDSRRARAPDETTNNIVHIL